jgi:hypothetical protein
MPLILTIFTDVSDERATLYFYKNILFLQTTEPLWLFWKVTANQEQYYYQIYGGLKYIFWTTNYITWNLSNRFNTANILLRTW